MLNVLIISMVLAGVNPQDTTVSKKDSVALAQLKDTTVVAARSVSPEAEEEISKPVVITHIKFKGIPVDGSMNLFGKRLEQEGFQRINTANFAGTFAGIEKTQIHCHSISGNVWKVSVCFPAQLTWNEVKTRYMKFKDLLVWKYVINPVVVKEQLSGKYREGSGQEAWGFENGTSEYCSVFEFLEGDIIQYIVFDKPSGGLRVCIDYVDRVNSILKDESDMMDL